MLSGRIACAQALVRAEYFWDNDPGAGNGAAVLVERGETVTSVMSVDVSGLAAGAHRLGLRVKNADDDWSAAQWLPVRVHDEASLAADAAAPVDERSNHLVSGEYFWDTAPAPGGGTQVTFAAGASLVASLDVDVSQLAAGAHRLGVRTKSVAGEWSAVQWLPILVHDGPGAATLDERQNDLVAGEYFWDTDPGLGAGTQVTFSGATEVDALNVNVAGLSAGEHRLGVRVKSAGGEWSAVQWLPIRVHDNESLVTGPFAPRDERPRALAEAEYFWNDDPGVGNGNRLVLPAGQTVVAGDPAALGFDVGLGDLPGGVNRLGVRVREESGRWSAVTWAMVDIPGTPVARLNGALVPSGVVHTTAGAQFTVELSTRFAGGTIYYSTDGSDPLGSGQVYAGAFTVTAPFSLRTLALDQNFTPSVEGIPVNTLFAATPGGGTVTVTSTFNEETGVSSAVLRGTANAGWLLQGWTDDASGTAGEITLAMDRPKTANAIFSTTLTTTSSNGTIERDPNAARYAYGERVRLSAIPAANYYFVQWGNAAAGTVSPIMHTVTAANATVGALFASLPAGRFALTLRAVGGGQVAKSPQAANYAANAIVNLTATPDAGWVFAGWSGDAAGNANPLAVTMSASKTITATFVASADAATIEMEPLDADRFVGEAASFSVTATGAAPLTYQWYFGETRLEGQTSARLEIPSARLADDGEYYVVVTNPYGSDTSRRARLRVTVRPNEAPTVSLVAPLATDSFRAPVDISLVAEAADSDGTIARVEFVGNGNVLGSVTEANPAGRYTYVWGNAPVGVNTIFARAFDNEGVSASTAPRDITVQPPQATAFAFAQGSYTFAENAGVVQLTVTKAGTSAAAVSFTTRALTAEVGRDFAEASGTLSFAANEASKTIAVQLLNEYVADGAKTFEVILSAPNNGAILGSPSVTTVTTTDDDVAGASLLEFRPSASRPLPAERGSAQVTLTPEGVGGWKFRWERFWRAGGSTAGDLDPGEYAIEFRPALGYQAPPSQTINLASAQARQLTANYQAVGNQAGGTLGVDFEPIAGAGVPRWRLSGDTAWRLGGELIQNLTPGAHLVEFEALAGFATPGARQAVVQAGVTTRLLVTYTEAPVVPDGVTAPSALTYRAIRDAQFAIPRLPFPMVGQLRTPAGNGSGIAVRDRVVLTAAHVLFDESRTNYFDPASIEWFQERNAGEYEPRPLRPIGFYVSENYLAQRTIERQSGMGPEVSGPASQAWDVAAVYFGEAVARNGQSGYLVSDLPANAWLMSGAFKSLAGYPLTGGAGDGKMHEVRGGNYNFTAAGQALFLTPDFLSHPGNSGGPVMVGVQEGAALNYFPAGVYLGRRNFEGRANSIVRGIDSGVATLIARAQSSAELGVNFLGGGFANVGGLGGVLSSAFLTVNLSPAGASAAGAGWRVSETEAFYASGYRRDLVAGTYTVSFAPVAGYVTPAPREITLQGGASVELAVAYQANEVVRPTITGVTLTAERKLRLNVGGAAGQRIVVEVSVDFARWDPAQTGTAPFVFETPAVGGPMYYRARVATE